MLTHLSVDQLTLVDHLELELEPGLTTITGETGAGKSILLSALGLAVGERGDADKVRKGAAKADVHACFDLRKLPNAKRWLGDNDLNQTEDECILRRTLSKEGRGRAFINGRPVTLQQLKQLGELLIDIHGQHEHQSLLKKDHHRRLLDNFAELNTLAKSVGHAYHDWRKAQQKFQQHRDNADEISARYQLLSYQVSELDDLDLSENELSTLEQQQSQLANAEDTLIKCQQINTLCDGDELGQSLRHGLNRAIQILKEIPDKAASLVDSEQMLEQALILVDEADGEVTRFIDDFDADPQRLHDIENRLGRIYDIARKHRIQPNELYQLHHQFSEELSKLSGADGDLDILELAVQQALEHYQGLSGKLSKKRITAAKKLKQQVNQQLQQLAMGSASLEIALNQAEQPQPNGNEDIEFLISTNPGQPHRPLAKVASGGELSRISLAIQVVTAQTSACASLVFDEVDVGIGGATADVVGRLLRQLGERCQVLCVTHLPQVASKAHQHLQVMKTTNKTSAASSLHKLTPQSRIDEIARMLGGEAITDQALAHAKEMLAS